MIEPILFYYQYDESHNLDAGHRSGIRQRVNSCSGLWQQIAIIPLVVQLQFRQDAPTKAPASTEQYGLDTSLDMINAHALWASALP